MGHFCNVCRHERAGQIGIDLVSGVSVRDVASKYGLSASSVWRHQTKHLPAAVKAELRKEPAHPGQLARPVLRRVEKLYGQVESVLMKAEEAKDHATLLAASRELRQVMELTARLTGELLPSGPSVNIDMRQEVKPEPEPDLSLLSREQLTALAALSAAAESMGIICKVVELRAPVPMTIDATPLLTDGR